MTYRSGDYRYGGEGRYRDERWRERNAGRDYGRGDYRGREFDYGDDDMDDFDAFLREEADLDAKPDAEAHGQDIADNDGPL